MFRRAFDRLAGLLAFGSSRPKQADADHVAVADSDDRKSLRIFSGPISSIRKRAQNLLYGRHAAEHAIEAALVRLRDIPPSDEQLDLVSDALDALADRTYAEAVRLAQSSIQPTPGRDRAPARQIEELQARFLVLLAKPFPTEN